MTYEIEQCSKCDCGSKNPIVNKRHFLCEEKNKERLHGSDWKEKKKASYCGLKRTPLKKPKKKIRQRSTQEEKEHKKYIEVCRQIDIEREPVCEGCGKGQGGDLRLSHSHVISRQEAKNIGLPELIYNKRNIRLHCLDFGNHKGCHTKWESFKSKGMLDHEKNMQFIRSLDEMLYNKRRLKNDCFKNRKRLRK